MTLADLPVLNPSTPAREAKRAVVAALLFGAFGVLYALARAAAVVPPDPAASSGDPFGFAFPSGWGIARSVWSGVAVWPSRLAAADMGTALAVMAIVLLAIGLVIVMHPDILSRHGPQYVSPARRITTVVIALALGFLVYWGVGKVDDIFSELATSPERAPRQLVGLAAVSALLFGGIWSFIGPKDFGRRIPLRISHGALGGLGLWAAVTFATYLSAQPRAFLSSSLDTFYTLLTLDAAAGSPGATAGWAVSADILAAGVAMAVAGAILVVTAPQSLGPGNRRGSSSVAGVLGAFLAVVGFTTWAQTSNRSSEVTSNIVEILELDRQAVARTPIVLGGEGMTPAERIVSRFPTSPRATADDCAHETGGDRDLPAAVPQNVTRLSSWLQAQGRAVNGRTIRAASCRAALQALLWDPEAARGGVFLSERPQRVGVLTYLYATNGISASRPGELRRYLAALADTSRFHHGSEAARRFADLARVSGDTATEASWRQRIIQPTSAGALSTMLARPLYVDGTVSGRLASNRTGWRVALLAAEDPTSGSDPTANVPRSEATVLSSMITATDVAADGRFSFSGLRDGYYMLALLSPAGTVAENLTALTVQRDPGVFQLPAARKALDLGTITVNY